MPGDIVVVTPFKAGTTWAQRIVQQILCNGTELETSLTEASPWLDSSWGDHAAMLATLKQQAIARERRVIKSHLPADALPRDSQARYIFVNRNGKDLGLSLHNYLHHFSEATMAEINSIYASWAENYEPLIIPDNPQTFFDHWLDRQGAGCCDLLDITKSWWQLRDEPNVLLLHYSQLKENLGQEIRWLATFLGAEPKTLNLEQIIEHCSFDYMRHRAAKIVPFGGAHLGNAKDFFQQGPKRNYERELTPTQIARFDSLAVQTLSSECAHWLETGLLPDVDP